MYAAIVYMLAGCIVGGLIGLGAGTVTGIFLAKLYSVDAWLFTEYITESYIEGWGLTFGVIGWGAGIITGGIGGLLLSRETWLPR